MRSLEITSGLFSEISVRWCIHQRYTSKHAKVCIFFFYQLNKYYVLNFKFLYRVCMILIIVHASGCKWGPSAIFSWHAGTIIGWFKEPLVLWIFHGVSTPTHFTCFYLQTIAVIPVVPHGVIQLGSPLAVSCFPYLFFFLKGIYLSKWFQYCYSCYGWEESRKSVKFWIPRWDVY